MQAVDKFSQPTTRGNQMWQTDFAYLKIIGWGWFYLFTVLGRVSADQQSGLNHGIKYCACNAVREAARHSGSQLLELAFER
jgi:hypothetical protein